MSKNNTKGCSITMGCGTFIILVLIVGLVVGGKCFNYVLDTLIGKTVPLPIATLGSLFTVDLTIPLAALCFILRSAGVHTPLFHIG